MILPHFVQSPLLRSVPGVYHAFLGIDRDRGRGDAERMRSVFSVPPSRIGTLKQVHSGTVLEMVEEDVSPGERGKREGDALWTTASGTGVGVHTADCVPVLLANPEVPVCMAVHAGWRGFAADILGEAVRILVKRFGTSVLGRLVAGAGPAARGCCYEVGEEVADLLAGLPGGRRSLSGTDARGKWNVDLQTLAVEALAAAGVPRRGVDAEGPCTVCSPLFHSFRREKSLTGRQLSFIYITGFSR